MSIVNNAVKAMEDLMTNEQVHHARADAEREVLAMRLAELRERRGIKQADFNAFSQTAVSKLERRKDMKVSTLIEYLDGIGMGLEIKAYTKDGKGSPLTETLLRV